MKRAREIEELLKRIVELANESDLKKITKKAAGICKKSTDLQFEYLPDSPLWGLINSRGKADLQLRDEAREYALKMQDNAKWLFHEITERNALGQSDFQAFLGTILAGDSDGGTLLKWIFRDEPDEGTGIMRLASLLMLIVGTKGCNRCQSCNSFILINNEHNKTICGSRCKQQLYRDRKLAEKKEAARKKREEFFNNNGGDK